jgi:hypothetical protein
MNDGVWKEMRDKEGGHKESDQKKINERHQQVQLPAPFTPLEKAAGCYWCTLAATMAD